MVFRTGHIPASGRIATSAEDALQFRLERFVQRMLDQAEARARIKEDKEKVNWGRDGF
jgi:hypothetical protein